MPRHVFGTEAPRRGSHSISTVVLRTLPPLPFCPWGFCGDHRRDPGLVRNLRGTHPCGKPWLWKARPRHPRPRRHHRRIQRATDIDHRSARPRRQQCHGRCRAQPRNPQGARQPSPQPRRQPEAVIPARRDPLVGTVTGRPLWCGRSFLWGPRWPANAPGSR